MPDASMEDLVIRLERAASELRSGELAPERAAVLVDECARLATEAAAELDRRVRGSEAGVAPAPGRPALGS